MGSFLIFTHQHQCIYFYSDFQSTIFEAKSWTWSNPRIPLIFISLPRQDLVALNRLRTGVGRCVHADNLSTGDIWWISQHVTAARASKLLNTHHHETPEKKISRKHVRTNRPMRVAGGLYQVTPPPLNYWTTLNVLDNICVTRFVW